MARVGKILLSGLLGGALCAALGFAMFFALAVVDGTKPVEAFAFSLLVAIFCAVVGAAVGVAIGIGNLGALGGALVGLLGTLAVAAGYVLLIGRAGERGYFLSESKIIFVVLTLPTILTGILTALLKNAFTKT